MTATLASIINAAIQTSLLDTVADLPAHNTIAGVIFDDIALSLGAIEDHPSQRLVFTDRIIDIVTIDSTVPNDVASRGNAFTGWSHFDIGAPDPAIAMAVTSSTGAAYDSTSPSSFRRVWADVLGPDGNFSPRAAFMSVGARVKGMQAGDTVLMDAVQAEVAQQYPTTTPTPYSPARSLNVSVRPDRLNYCDNPAFDVSTSGWAAQADATGTVAVSRVADAGSTFGGNLGRFTVSAALAVGGALAYFGGGVDTSQYAAPGLGTQWSARIRLRKVGTGTGLTVTGGLYTYPIDVNLPYYQMSSGNVTLPDDNSFVELVVTGTQPISSLSGKLTMALRSTRVVAAGEGIDIDAALIERTHSPGTIFTGSSGANYLWEQGATPGLARSYYYADRANRTYLLKQVLAENVPLGVVPAVPVFATLPKD